MTETQIEPPCKLHRLFRFYDSELVAVMTILFGVFQALLGLPTYYMSINIEKLHICPVFIGTVYVAGGSLAMACERNPSRKMVKSCLYASATGLLMGLCAIAVYGYAINDIKSVKTCDWTMHSLNDCPQDGIVEYFKSVSAVLLVYDMGALTLQGFLLFSAMRALKTN